MLALSAVLDLLLVAVASGQDPGTKGTATERYNAFGITQFYESDSADWLFLDVDTIGPPIASGSNVNTISFVAIAIKSNGTIQVYRSADDLLTAHENQVRFVIVDGAVHAVRYDRRAAWRFSHEEAKESSVERIDVGIVQKAAGGSKRFESLLKGDDAKLEKKGAGNYGYGDPRDDGYESSRRKARLILQSVGKGRLGWNAIAVALNRDRPKGREVRIEIETLMLTERSKSTASDVAD